MGFFLLQTEDAVCQWKDAAEGWGARTAIPCLPAGAQGGNAAMTLQVVLKAQLGSSSSTLLTEGGGALD